MKNAIFAILLSTACLATPKKLAHVATESEMCWKDVVALADVEFPLQTEDKLKDEFSRLWACSDTLKADKFKSRVAFQLSVVAAETMALNQQRQELASAKAAQATSEQSVENLVKAYADLQTEYKNYQTVAVNFAEQVNAYFASIPSQPTYQPEPQIRGARGFFANVFQGMSDAAKANAAKPTIHCESSTFGNQTSTDCR